MKKTAFGKKKRLSVALAIIVAFSLILAAFVVSYLRNGGLFVDVLPREGVSFVFLSVGQASSTIVFTDGGVLLIDTGSNDSEETVLSAFSYYGVTELEYVILTHADEDHAGGLDAILNAYKVKSVMLTESAYGELKKMREGKSLASALSAKKTSLLIVTSGDICSVGTSHLEILAPSEYDEALSEGGNEASLILLLEYGETRAIFSGDADKTGELNALTTLVEQHPGLSYDILLVGHHGSATSSCEQFVRYLKPRYAVISCGENNTYGHPSIEVVKRLEDVGAKILRTDRDGTVVLHSNGKTVTIFSTSQKVS